jgi:dUTP pyrophosphatase
MQHDIRYVQLESADGGLVLGEPTVATPGSAGIDLRSSEDVMVKKYSQLRINTGLRLEIPPGYFGTVAGRSGLALRHAVEPFCGTIDSDYRGNIQVLLRNYSERDYRIERGDRIAQLIIQPYLTNVRFLCVQNLEPTARGSGGFGSTDNGSNNNNNNNTQ